MRPRLVVKGVWVMWNVWGSSPESACPLKKKIVIKDIAMRRLHILNMLMLFIYQHFLEFCFRKASIFFPIFLFDFVDFLTIWQESDLAFLDHSRYSRKCNKWCWTHENPFTNEVSKLIITNLRSNICNGSIHKSNQKSE